MTGKEEETVTIKNNSNIDLSECQAILKKEYSLPDEEILWI